MSPPRAHLAPFLIRGVLAAGFLIPSTMHAQGVVEELCDTGEEQCSDERMSVVFSASQDSRHTAAISGFDLQYDWDTMVVDVSVELETSDNPVECWSVAVAHDDSVLEVLPSSVSTNGTTALESIDTDTYLFEITEVVDGGIVSTVVMSFGAPRSLSPNETFSVLNASYRILSDPGPDGTVLRLAHDELGLDDDEEKVPLNVIVGGISLMPHEVIHGQLFVEELPGESFIRGDAGGDGIVDLSDGILLLGVLFHGRSQPYACRDAMDSNDDGEVDVSDGVAILQFLFRGGETIAAPFPGCGRDRTPEDTTDCVERAASCTPD